MARHVVTAENMHKPASAATGHPGVRRAAAELPAREGAGRCCGPLPNPQTPALQDCTESSWTTRPLPFLCCSPHISMAEPSTRTGFRTEISAASGYTVTLTAININGEWPREGEGGGEGV